MRMGLTCQASLVRDLAASSPLASNSGATVVSVLMALIHLAAIPHILGGPLVLARLVKYTRR